MKKKYIQLPKTYLSYSQVQLWKNSKQRYIELYFNDNKAFSLNNSGLKYGKVVADALEKGIETGDLLTDAAMLLLPKYDVADKEIQAEIKTDCGWLKIIGRPDSLNSETKEFYEFKTGKGKWTQNKAQKHPQMVFYAMLIYLKYKIILDHAHLIWIETEEILEEYPVGSWLPGGKLVIKPTGYVEQFYVTFTLQDILKCMADTVRVAKEIELEWISYDKNKLPVLQ